MFFVLSGFIITSLLIHEKKLTGMIDWKAFLVKRFSKLIPSLLFLIFIIQVFQNHWMGSCRPRDSIVSLLFLSELLGISCWELAHTWSLSVEELFYISWIPCFVLLSKNRLMRILVGVCIASPILRTYTHLTHSHPEWFEPHFIFSIPWISNLDLIALGSMGAFGWDYYRLQKIPLGGSTNNCRIIYTTSGLLLFFTALPFTEIPSLKFLSYAAVLFRSTLQGLLLVILMVALISMPYQRIGFFKRSIAYIGSISYSLYLFQQVVIPNRFSEVTKTTWSLPSAIFYLLLTLGVGALNYHYLELPCLKYLRTKWEINPSKLSLAGEETG